MELTRVGEDTWADLGRGLYLARLSALADWPDTIDLRCRYFTLLVVMDARAVSDDELVSFADRLIEQGLAGAASWGPECSRVELGFDQAIVRRELEFGVEWTDETLIATTSHESETLSEALWDGLHVLAPSDGRYSGYGAFLAIVVAHQRWAEHVQRRLADPDLLDSEVVESDDSGSR